MTQAHLYPATSRLATVLGPTQAHVGNATNVISLYFINMVWNIEGINALGIALTYDMDQLNELRFTKCQLPQPLDQSVESLLLYEPPQADQGRARHLAKLEFSNIRIQQGGEDFYQATHGLIAEHLRQGSLEWIQHLVLTCVGMNDAHLDSMIGGFRGNQGASMTIKSLILAKNKLSHIGVESLLRAMSSQPGGVPRMRKMKHLDLRENVGVSEMTMIYPS